MALPPNQGAPWPPQMQGQVPRPQGQPNYPTPAQQQQQMAMQRQMQAQQQFGAAPQGGMPKQQPGAGPQPLNRLPAANAGSISFNVSGAQPKGPVHAQMVWLPCLDFFFFFFFLLPSAFGRFSPIFLLPTVRR
jgi:hypothetical protein